MSVSTLHKRVSSTIAAAALAVTGMFMASPDADANPNPIEWGINATVIGPNGEDLPLRFGQHDFGNDDGFGIYHIQDGHGGFVPSSGEIEIVINEAPGCGAAFNPGNGTQECTAPVQGRPMTVAATERVDTRSGDGRPVGIITAFYR